MAAYLIVDVDDLLERVGARGLVSNIHELAAKLRGGAALAAGLSGPDQLKAIAVANWENYAQNPDTEELAQIFQNAGFETFHVPDRALIADTLIIQYFSFDPDPVDELIIVTRTADVTTLIRRVQMQRGARIRIWSDVSPRIDGVVVQPLEAILGLQAKTVSLYIDFENIAISLHEQGYAVDLDAVIDGLRRQGSAHGQITHMAAYAPWGQRGSLPMLMDSQGRDITQEAMNRLLLANIEPRVTLPGKNSADLRIAQDVLDAANQRNASDIFIVASGDRDFNDMFNTLRARGKQVVVWGVRGTISRMLQLNSALQVEYVDDFLKLPMRTALNVSLNANGPFTPSQWSSVVLQYDRLAAQTPGDGLPIEPLQDQLKHMSVVTSDERAHDLIEQALALDILRKSANDGGSLIYPVADHPIVERTRLVRDRIVTRVANTLDVRNWEYVNYGFLLKGLAMDRALERPGMNLDDAWRSDWIECLVHEGLLVRELVPHRHNASDLVPVIKLPRSAMTTPARQAVPATRPAAPYEDDDIGPGGPDIDYDAPFDPTAVYPPVSDAEIEAMMKRIVVSVDQFTSYRRFTWCPLGSLHKRLRPHDSGMSFQRAVERLLTISAVAIDEYDNPLSPYRTKGISLVPDSEFVSQIINERNQFVRILINMYDQHFSISVETLMEQTGIDRDTLLLWLSMMQLENVLNPVPNKLGQYALFRGHHTVNLIAGTPPDDVG
ncbi:MAG: NYN domain-containing protein [Aggregatilineales bacterium]